MVGKRKKNYFWLIVGLVILAILSFFFLKIKKGEKPMNEKIKEEKASQAALIIAFEGFQDKEYGDTREVLEKAGIKTGVFSSKKGEAQGKMGEMVKIEKTIEELRVDDYEAIVFIGGPGALEYLENRTAWRIAREAVEKNKVLAAICIAPEILAKAGVLKGKKATVWSSSLDQEEIKALEEAGALYSNENVVIDGKIVTANGPMSAKKFAQEIIKLLGN